MQRRLFKSNSTSTILLQSTMSSPNVKLIIQAVATLLHSNITEDIMEGKVISPQSELYYFSEEKYISENPQAFEEERIALLRKTPSRDEISGFIEAIYDLAQFSPECCVICLVYINRINALTDMPLLPTTWRPLVIISLMIAQKMWDDKYLSNADFQYIYPFFDSNQFNVLEIKFLDLIQYNTHIKLSIYTKYYLELKSLSPDDFPLEPMSVYQLTTLEKRSSNMEDQLKKASQTGTLKSLSGINSAFSIN
jgi:hypothetical protein